MSNAAQNSTAKTDWQQIPRWDGLFEICRAHGPVPLRAVAVQLQPGSVCVYSPVPRAGEAAMRSLASLGNPILLAPNAFHTLGLREHAAAFQGARVVASGRAAPRVHKTTGLKIEELAVLRDQLPNDVSLLELPPVRNGEVWLSVRSNGACAWIVSDGFLNLPRRPAGPLGLLFAALRMGPGLSISSTFKWMVKRQAAYRDWLLARIAEDQPTLLIPSHGQIIDDPVLPRRLAEVVQRRL